MLDIKKIRENPEYYIAETEKKYTTVSLRDVLAVDNERRPLLTEVERLKSERNAQSKRIGELKKKGENADEAQAATRELGNKIDELDKKLKELDYKQTEMLMHVPNIAPRSPEGKDSSDNVVEKDGPIPFDYYTKNDDFARVDHKTLGERLGIFDFERGAKISGSGFPVYRGWGSRLERALIQFFLDEHMKNGFEEFTPPYLVTRNTMRGTGQLPKFEEDMYRCDKDDDLFLIPTAEVPLTNLYAGEVIPESELPKRICAYSACFRREAGSYGKDTRGLLRRTSSTRSKWFTSPIRIAATKTTKNSPASVKCFWKSSASPTTVSPSVRVTSVSVPPSATTSKFTLRSKRSGSKSAPARTSKTTRHAAPTSKRRSTARTSTSTHLTVLASPLRA